MILVASDKRTMTAASFINMATKVLVHQVDSMVAILSQIIISIGRRQSIIGKVMLMEASMDMDHTVFITMNRKTSLVRRTNTSARSSSTTQKMIMVVFNLTRFRTQRIIASEAILTLITTNRPIKSCKTSLMALLNARAVLVKRQTHSSLNT